jgi:prefoldin subunit 5
MNAMKREIFKPIAIIASIALLVVIGYGVYLNSQKTEQMEALQLEKSNLSENITQRDSTINDLFYTFNEIDENMTFIKARRSQLSLEASEELNVNRKTAILNDIRLMDSMLVASGQHIEDLEKRLKDSGIKMRAFENRISALNTTLSESGAEIEMLRVSLDEKNYQISGLSTQIEEFHATVEEKEEVIRVKENVIVEKENQISNLNTAWYTMGSFKELKEHGILSRTGGILGLGSTKSVQENFSNEYFTELDIREVKTIPISSTKSARIVTDHPHNSYDFVYADGLISALVIENPDEFWKISKYVVIETK